MIYIGILLCYLLIIFCLEFIDDIRIARARMNKTKPSRINKKRHQNDFRTQSQRWGKLKTINESKGIRK